MLVIYSNKCLWMKCDFSFLASLWESFYKFQKCFLNNYFVWLLKHWLFFTKLILFSWVHVISLIYIWFSIESSSCICVWFYWMWFLMWMRLIFSMLMFNLSFYFVISWHVILISISYLFVILKFEWLFSISIAFLLNWSLFAD